MHARTHTPLDSLQSLSKHYAKFAGDILLRRQEKLQRLSEEVEAWTDEAVGIFHRLSATKSDPAQPQEHTAMVELNTRVYHYHEQLGDRVAGEGGVASGLMHVSTPLETWLVAAHTYVAQPQADKTVSVHLCSCWHSPFITYACTYVCGELASATSAVVHTYVCVSVCVLGPTSCVLQLRVGTRGSESQNGSSKATQGGREWEGAGIDHCHTGVKRPSACHMLWRSHVATS